ncbi:MAG: hypothetical protein DSY83_14500, partial [Flavobacteriia bacterium]
GLNLSVDSNRCNLKAKLSLLLDCAVSDAAINNAQANTATDESRFLCLNMKFFSDNKRLK